MSNIEQSACPGPIGGIPLGGEMKFRNAKGKIFFPVFFLFLFININAQDEGTRILKDLQDKFETVNDLSADVIQISMGQTLSGKLKFKKENSFRLDLKNNIIVSNGSYIWNFNKKDKKVIISDYDENDPGAISINKIVYEYPSKSTAAAEQDASGDILILTPDANSGLNFSSVKIWISKENLINKVLLDSDSGKTEVRFANYRLNQNLSDSEFIFIPPEGSTVIDLR